MKSSCSVFKKQVEKILAQHKKLEDFVNAEDFHSRFESNGFMPLVIEKHGSRVSVTHYFEQNGDLICDPDMEFLVGADGEWYPVAIQFSTGHYARARFWRDGKEYIVPKEIRDQIRFSAMWAQNLKWQGF